MGGRLEALRAWGRSSCVRRAVDVGMWALVAVLAVLVVRRYLPDRSLDDLGPAPAFEHATLDGRTVGLEAAAGRVAVVNVWATWCPPCVVETPGFVDLAAEFEGDVQFFGVSVDDDVEAVEAFVARYGVPYPVLVGANRAGPPIAAPVLPTTLVIDREGRVRMRHEGLLLEPALRAVLRDLVAE